MHTEKTNSRTNRIMIIALCFLGIMITVGFLFGRVYGEETGGASAPITYNAKDTAQPVGTAANPFTVLEIVPDRSLATMGYMIPGCEPVDNLEDTASGVIGRYKEIFAQPGGIAEVSDEDDIVTSFWLDMPEWVLKLGNEKKEELTFYDAPKDGVDESKVMSYGQYGYFEHASKEQPGNYKYIPAPEEGTEGYFEGVTGYFDGVTTDDADAIKAGTLATYRWIPLQEFTQEMDENVTGPYLREGNTYTNQPLEDEENKENSYMRFVEGGIATSGTTYQRVDLVSDINAELPETNESLKEIVLTEGQLGKKEVDLEGKRYYQYRCEEKYIVYPEQKVKHKDQWIQTLFPGKSTASGFVSQVVTVTPDQMNSLRDGKCQGLGIIQDADMIIIHDSNAAQPVNFQYLTEKSNNNYNTSQAKSKFYYLKTETSQIAGDCCTEDISEEIYNAIIKRQASGSPAMMMLDESAIDECQTAAWGRHDRTRMEKLYTVLNKYGAKRFYNVFVQDEGKDREADPDDEKYQVFQYDNHEQGLHQGITTFQLNWGGEDIFTSFPADEKFLTYLGELPYETSASQASQASQAEGNRRKLNILELQPVVPPAEDENADSIWQAYYQEKTDENGIHYAGWRDYYLSLCPWFVGEHADIAAAEEGETPDIRVTRKATYEFNGDIEDLNSTYDLIVIGSYQDDTNGLQGYNDSQLGNMAYTAVGDLIDTYNGYWSDSWFIYSDYGSPYYQANIRYSGTDVSEKKFEELIDFSQKNLIVTDQKLYTSSGANTKVDDAFVDKNSFVAVIAGMALDKTNEVQHVKMVNDAMTQRDLVEKNTCYMEFSDNGSGENGKPVDYSYTTADGTEQGEILNANQNTQVNENNQNVLQYHFTLHGVEERPYQVVLYLDNNGNGNFETEEKNGAENLIVCDNTEGERNRIVDLKTENMVAGHTYTVTRVLPDGKNGLLPWKLVTYDKDNESVRDSETGSTRIVSRIAKKEKIRVLQMNLTADMSNIYDTKKDSASNEKDGDWSKDPSNLANTGNDIGKQFQTYLKAVQDYDVEISYMTNQDWKAKFNNKPQDWKNYLLGENGKEGVDMLVLGFRDMAEFTNNKTYVEGFKAYVDADRSVILSHDMIMDNSYANHSTEGALLGGSAIEKEIAMYLRNVGGQQVKHFYVDDKGKICSSYAYSYSNGKQVSFLPKPDMKLHNSIATGDFKWENNYNLFAENYQYQVPRTGFTAGTLMDNPVRVMTQLNNLLLDRNAWLDRLLPSEVKKNTKQFSWTRAARTNKVQEANSGQITCYPYNIPSQIEVATTHAQNYKLNLDRELVGKVKFKIDGQYDDWEGVPAQDPICYPYNPANQGSLVYQDGYAWGHMVTQSGNYPKWESMQFTIRNEDGSKSATVNSSTYYPVDEDGNITYSGNDLQKNNFSEGETRYYCFGYLSKTTNIYDVYQDDYNKEVIYGLMEVTHGKDKDEMEYSLNIPGILENVKTWNNNAPTIEEIAEVQTWSYGIGGPENPFTSNFTKSYVEGLKPDTSNDAIVWYNLSGGQADYIETSIWTDESKTVNYKTKIYSAREGDSANNYYIYTKGNITYTGFGHKFRPEGEDTYFDDVDVHKEAITNDEMRLLVNTMISAYRPPVTPPYLTVANPGVVNNKDFSTIYIEEDTPLDTEKSVNVELVLQDDSLDRIQNKVYHVRAKDEEGNLITIPGWSNYYDEETNSYIVSRDQNLSFPVSINDVIGGSGGKKTYTFETYASYESNGNVKKTSVSKRVVRVMRKPLFNLH